jgi:hypothetical protein
MTRYVYAASAASLLIGLFFIFVWTPLPWGWKGIDGYDAIALGLAAALPLADGPLTLDESMAHAATLTRDATLRTLRLILLGWHK